MRAQGVQENDRLQGVLDDGYLVFVIPPALDGRTADDVLRHAAGVSRHTLSRAKYLDGGIMLDGARIHTDVVVHTGDDLRILLADSEERVQASSVLPEASAEALAKVHILYEDDALVIANKPAGMAMYPCPGHWHDTLGNVLLARAQAAGRQVVLHPVQRLDIGTSGVVVLAYNAFVQHRLSGMLHTSDFVRDYVAFCCGVPGPPQGSVNIPIARIDGSPQRFCAAAADDPRGRWACTRYCVEAEGTIADRPVARVRLRLETGRTHQIRIHLAALGCPLLGDAAYGGEAAEDLGAAAGVARPALHAARVELVHPITGERIVVDSPLPDDLQHLCKSLTSTKRWLQV